MNFNPNIDRPKPCLPLGLCAAFLVVACASSGCDLPKREAKPNVIILVLDACRPDKLGCYGFSGGTSPFVDRLAADPDSVVFERHYVQADWTKPSTASLFTGMYVQQHRVALSHEPSPEEHPYFSQVLADEFRTMAEDFDEAGYATLGVTRIPHLLPKYGFGQGFDEYLYLGEDRDVSRAALLFASHTEQPIFGYLHFLACHNPFPVSSRDPEYMREFGFPYDEAARIADGIDFTKGSLNQDVNEDRISERLGACL